MTFSALISDGCVFCGFCQLIRAFALLFLLLLVARIDFSLFQLLFVAYRGHFHFGRHFSHLAPKRLTKRQASINTRGVQSHSKPTAKQTETRSNTCLARVHTSLPPLKPTNSTRMLCYSYQQNRGVILCTSGNRYFTTTRWYCPYE